jgi:hypothetical protein
MLALTNFDSTWHDDHIMDAAPLAARTSAHVGFIGLDDFFGLTADPILIWSHHASAQLVKNLEGSFVARQSELPLELNSRYAGCLTGDPVRRPEPNRERRVCALHDGASGEARVAVGPSHGKASQSCPATANHTGRIFRLVIRHYNEKGKTLVHPAPEAFDNRHRRFTSAQFLISEDLQKHFLEQLREMGIDPMNALGAVVNIVENEMTLDMNFTHEGVSPPQWRECAS